MTQIVLCSYRGALGHHTLICPACAQELGGCRCPRQLRTKKITDTAPCYRCRSKADKPDVVARAKRICIALGCGAPSTIFEVVIEALLEDHQEAKREAIIKEVRRQLARKERR